MMFLAFVMFSVFIVGLAQGRVLPTPLKSEEGEEELSGVTVVARDENVDDDDHRPMIYSSSLTLSSSSLIELSACECYFAAYEKRDAAKRNAENAVGVGLRCDKEGYFICLLYTSPSPRD